MSDDTKIEWADATWNPITGCTKVSPGCDNCYAETFAERWRGTPGHYFENGFDVTLRPERLDQPKRWTKPRRIFVNSMSDVFHEDVPDGFIAAMFDVMAVTPQHTYQVLTKRHGRMRSLLNKWARHDWLRRYSTLTHVPYGGPLPNVWLGVSVEDQKRAELRIQALLGTPAALRFLSCEPLLGPVDLKGAVWMMGDQRGHGLTASYVHAGGCCKRFHGLDWVIVGGESGPGARPCELVWIEDIVNACHEAEVPVFVKQFGTVLGREFGAGPKGGNIDRWPAYLQHRHFPAAREAVPA